MLKKNYSYTIKHVFKGANWGGEYEALAPLKI